MNERKRKEYIYRKFNIGYNGLLRLYKSEETMKKIAHLMRYTVREVGQFSEEEEGGESGEKEQEDA